MKQILVTKTATAYAAKTGGGTISGINEINLLDTGAIAVFTEDNVLITAAGVVGQTSDIKKFYIAVGNQQTNATSKLFCSEMIPRMLLNYDKKAYVAPVKLIKYIGYDGTTSGTSANFPTLVAGQEAFVKIINRTSGLHQTIGDNGGEILRYSYLVRTGDTGTEIIAALVAAINADENKFVTAVAQTTPFGIKLTADDYDTTFDVAVDGILSNATIVQPESATWNATTAQAVAMKYGDGTSGQIADLELTYSSQRGNENQIELYQYYWKLPSNVVDGGTYDTYTFTWNGRKAISTGELNTMRFTVIVAIPASATHQANFETIMKTLVGLFESSETGS